MNPIIEQKVNFDNGTAVAFLEVYGQYRYLGKEKHDFDVHAHLSFDNNTIQKLDQRVEAKSIADGDHVQKVLVGTIKVENPNIWWPIKFG